MCPPTARHCRTRDYRSLAPAANTRDALDGLPPIEPASPAPNRAGYRCLDAARSLRSNLPTVSFRANRRYSKMIRPGSDHPTDFQTLPGLIQVRSLCRLRSPSHAHRFLQFLPHLLLLHHLPHHRIPYHSSPLNSLSSARIHKCPHHQVPFGSNPYDKTRVFCLCIRTFGRLYKKSRLCSSPARSLEEDALLSLLHSH